MRATGTEFELLYTALMDAYPSRSSLERLVRFHLNRSLNNIVGEGNQQDVVFQLLVWADANGQIDALLKGAVALNPGNETLATTVQMYFADRNQAAPSSNQNGNAVAFSPAVTAPASCVSELEKLSKVELRRRIDLRLNFDEVKLVWNDTFGDSLDAQLPGQTKTLCIAEMITRAEQRHLAQMLLTNLCSEYPHVGRA